MTRSSRSPTPNGRISGTRQKSSTWTSGKLSRPHALYYPFHLCHDRTLHRLLDEFETVHFRDYMSLRLTAMAGTLALPDRMGDYHPELLHAGRIVQGYDVSGAVRGELRDAVDRDLADPEWRAIFHDGLREDRRFQRGLFDLSHSMMIGGTPVPGPAALLRLLDDSRRRDLWTVERLEGLAARQTDAPSAYDYEYGMALVKTAAALGQTIQLASVHRLVPVTDSPVHDALLRRTSSRNGHVFSGRFLTRDGY